MNNNSLEKQYVETLKRVLSDGYDIEDRTGTGCRFITGVQLVYDVRKDNVGPCFLGRRVLPSLGYKEMLWFLMGKTDKTSLNELGVKYWDEFFKEDGTIGKSYGYQMRNFNGVDQLRDFLDGIKNNPFSRRHILTLWNVNDLPEMSLPPCFYNYQVCVFKDDDGLSFDLIVTSRSTDSFLGFPYNVYTSLFLAMVVDCYCFKETPKVRLNRIVWNSSHFHIYNNHFDQVNEYIENYEKVTKDISLDSDNGNFFVHRLKSFIYEEAMIEGDLDVSLDELYKLFKDNEYRETFTFEEHVKVIFDGSVTTIDGLYTPKKINAPLSV